MYDQTRDIIHHRVSFLLGLLRTIIKHKGCEHIFATTSWKAKNICSFYFAAQEAFFATQAYIDFLLNKLSLDWF